MQQQNINQNESSLHAIDYWQVLKNRYGVILLTFLLVFLTAAVITYVMPKKYESSALVEVKPINDVSPTMMQTAGTGPVMTRQFMNTQFEIIVAPSTLELAIDKKQLETRWGQDRKTVLNTLRGIVQTNQRRGTDLIEISVRHRKKEDAQAVAEAVYQAYEQRRNDLEMGIRREQLKAIQVELQNKSDRVAEMRKRLMDIAEKVGVIWVESERGGEMIGGQLELRNLAEKQLYEANREKEQLSFQINKLLTLDDDELVAVAAELPEVGFSDNYNQFVAAKRDLQVMLAQGLGPQHPDIKARKASIAELDSSLKKRAVNVRESLKYKLKLVEGRVEKMEEVLNDQQDRGTEKARSFQEFNLARKEYQTAQSIKDQMEVKYDLEKAKLVMPPTNIILHQVPEIQDTPVSPNVPLNLALGAVVGLIFGVGIAFCLEYLDTSVKSLEDVERFLNVPVLAVIPKDVGVLHKQSGMSPDAEAYRILRTNIEFNRKNPEDNSITVVSGGAGEGKSTTLVNLAYICAQGGYTTLMIDADLRRPRLHTFFDINNSVGLTNYLTTDLLLEDVILQTPVDNLYFMPSGILPADAAGILNSRRMSELIQDVKQRFDLVLVDSPPILGVSDASVLASEVDLTMIVVQHRKLPRNMLLRVKQAVENVGGQVIGVVLNNVDVRSDNQYQYYTSYYTYYAPTSGEDNQQNVQASTNAKQQSKSASSDEDLY
ncbi:polysaccharide biosynthesis tyrosine autokinase [Verrucomicrobiaceae bacterium R5-34]|uniref:Polysaccharide biosynthesis tyrosine autokinase n=1 Tax=Oceaniferula flava TaxID=2800421 RepID=A0AAE2SBU9_9BACT|nr:polysaccharide biosynthesis tyrosine autokinase [Oceaniferula flavus]MBK1831599.1 polysaccharide biosynthesis tyrosine autokinase [Verrucomicrobiaceae bacterium R5-34]MBK1854064.1 polysaccharide biosynthesis tyrosine autokinase [Oceaniferula flavus]MBM1135370.1 polysaccharide biosynthesis tyrosine autokinase [Oceaniferula flavus]